jgi:putative permease
MAFLVGISVLIPYLGAALVTIPILLIAFLQWGWSAHFAYLAIVYGIILILDAHILMPILFANIVKLHPMSIILAVLVFGEMWGFWGVFFAIPLACLVKALLNLWLKHPARVH